MTALAAVRGSGTSSWPSMQRPPADEENDGSSSGPRRKGSTPAIMNYVSPETTDISTRRDLGGSDSTLVGAIWNPTLVKVANARLLMGWEEEGEEDNRRRMTLDANGFELWTNSEREEDKFRSIDFTDQDRVVDDYYKTCERLVSDAIMSQKSSTKASSPPIACICAFDHNVRSSDKASVGKISSKHVAADNNANEDGKKSNNNNSNNKSATTATPQVQNPAGLVHADYTKTSAPRRLRDLSNPPKLNDVLRPKLIAENRRSLLDPTMVEEALEGKRRYSFINVWRSIDAENPVKNPPLACIDAATASVDDLRMFKIHYVDRVGENYFVCPPSTSSSSPPSSSSSSERGHSWYYYPDMTMKEALLLKQWDSVGGVACGARSDGAKNDYDVQHGSGWLSTFTIHSAFIDPSICQEESLPRKSIEVRCVVIWEKDI
eukprot:CAMPEP_0196132388 /NCGR_PEP_ID=MMETSP0910-20130528/2035_1 /TAXON_ID=49265 /ORGANISM="Thalassiosira rotula, Strain GSO102" /LENGTH=433 /DNA_ID=CAMNT_0041391995 /DNA_START=146 /DNA_END=1447 /DNA_ORIENTATION=+